MMCYVPVTSSDFLKINLGCRLSRIAPWNPQRQLKIFKSWLSYLRSPIVSHYVSCCLILFRCLSLFLGFPVDLLLFQVAHLVLDEAAASSLLRRFIACRSSLLRDILEGSGAASPGHKENITAVGCCWMVAAKFFLNHVYNIVVWWIIHVLYACLCASVWTYAHTHTRDRQL